MESLVCELTDLRYILTKMPDIDQKMLNEYTEKEKKLIEQRTFLLLFFYYYYYYFDTYLITLNNKYNS